MTTDGLIERIANGRTDLVWDYVAAGNLAASDAGGRARLLEWVAYYGDVSALRFLLEHGASLESLGANLGLNGAAFHGHWQFCEFLIEAGAQADAAAKETGETPLHSALCTSDRSTHDLVVKVLLAHGADPNRATTPGVTTDCFMRDCRTKGETSLHRAAAFGSEATIDLLLDAGAAVAAKDINGETPLSWASWHGRPDPVLRRLCYGPFAIHPERRPLQASLRGQPHARP